MTFGVYEVQNIHRNISGTSLYKCKKTPTHMICCCYPTKQERKRKKKIVLFIIQNTAKSNNLLLGLASPGEAEQFKEAPLAHTSTLNRALSPSKVSTH